MMKYIILFSFAFWLYACTSQTTGTESPLTYAATPLNTPGTTKLSTLSLISQTPSLETLFSTADNCPSDRFILDKYPEFSSDVSLAVSLDGKLGLVDLKTGARKVYDEITTIGNSLSASLDGKHIAYLSIDNANKKLWIFTPSIENLPKSFAIPSDTVWLSWLTGDKVALWNYPDSNGCYPYGGFFDLKTEIVTQPPNGIPELDETKCRLFPSISDDGLKALYPWQIRNLITGTTSDIHLVDNITTDPPYYFLDWSDDSISIISFEENALSYALDLSIYGLENQSIKLKTVQMPAFATKSHYWMLPVIGSDLNQFGWDLIANNTDVSDYYADPSKGNLPTSFYRVSLDTSQFINYCLNRSTPHDVDKASLAKQVHKGYFSPDGKYLAWTIYSTADYTPPIETQVLDLETGKVVVIKDVQTFGWVTP